MRAWISPNETAAVSESLLSVLSVLLRSLTASVESEASASRGDVGGSCVVVELEGDVVGEEGTVVDVTVDEVVGAGADVEVVEVEVVLPVVLVVLVVVVVVEALVVDVVDVVVVSATVTSNPVSAQVDPWQAKILWLTAAASSGITTETAKDPVKGTIEPRLEQPGWSKQILTRSRGRKPSPSTFTSEPAGPWLGEALSEAAVAGVAVVASMTTRAATKVPTPSAVRTDTRSRYPEPRPRGTGNFHYGRVRN